MRDHVWFDEILEIKDHLVSTGLKVGIFNSKHTDQAMMAAKYRLFSVVEHVGEFANRGHYICHTMDNVDNW
jgi:ubiquitin C-terminal hydrolase